MTKFILILLFILILGVVLAINWQALRQERSSKLWIVYGVLYLAGGLICLLDLLGVQLPSPFRSFAPALTPISKWLMLQ